MLWHKIQGAGGVGGGAGITFVGAVTFDDGGAGQRYFGITSGQGWAHNADWVDIESIAQDGDLVVLAVSSDDGGSVGSGSDWTWSTGATFTNICSNSSAVRNQTLYRFWQSGDANPAPTPVSGYTGISVVAAVFRGVNSYLSCDSASTSTGMPDPPSLTQSGTKLWVAVGHMDDDEVTMTAQTNFTMAGADSGSFSTSASSTGISYWITDAQTTVDPDTFGGGFSDNTMARTIAFD